MGNERWQWMNVKRKWFGVNFIVIWSLWARLPRTATCSLLTIWNGSIDNGRLSLSQSWL